MEPSLLILAGGLGSRYGGLKQVDGFGPNKEAILDYSIFDAIKAGFKKIIILTTEELIEYFNKKYIPIFESLGKIRYNIVPQPQGYGLGNHKLPLDRINPWGTGHAVICCENVINEPFATINADDFYGYGGYKKMYNTLKKIEHSNFHAFVVSYLLKNTLSNNGSVSRGVCDTHNFLLKGIKETHKIELDKKQNKIFGFQDEENDVFLNSNQQVSMNLFGFRKSFVEHLKNEFVGFLNQNINHLTKEFLLPEILNSLIENNKKIYIKNTNEKWFGITFKEDKQEVIKNINYLIKENKYPVSLWAK